MRCRCWLLPVLLLVVSSLSAQAGLTPNDVVVVVNNHPSVAAVSRAVGEYYCNQRAIPLSNILEVTVTPNETIWPSDFVNNIQVPLKNFLQSRFGVDPNNAAADPIKAVVLCYGVPMRIVQGERYASVDSALTLLFNSTPWGLEPVAMWGVDLNANYSAVANPYYESYVDTPDYLERSKATNFSEFRASTQNDWTRAPSNTPPPAFSLIRMLDTTHALAATDRDGGLFRGTRLESGQWEWTSVQDKDKGFIIFGVSDICVLDAQHVMRRFNVHVA